MNASSYIEGKYVCQCHKLWRRCERWWINYTLNSNLFCEKGVHDVNSGDKYFFCNELVNESGTSQIKQIVGVRDGRCARLLPSTSVGSTVLGKDV